MLCRLHLWRHAFDRLQPNSQRSGERAPRFNDPLVPRHLREAECGV